MCMYCNMGDHTFKYDPPWEPRPWPQDVPQPLTPASINPWDLKRLQEYYELLKGIKELEDKLGCPCEPNKADYIGMFKKRIDALKKKSAQKRSRR